MRISDWSSDVCSSDLLILSAATGEGMDRLHQYIVDMARTMLPREGEAALRQRQRAALAEAKDWLMVEAGSRAMGDLILVAERLRLAPAEIEGRNGGESD